MRGGRDAAAQRVAVHAEFARGSARLPVVGEPHGETALEIVVMPLIVSGQRAEQSLRAAGRFEAALQQLQHTAVHLGSVGQRRLIAAQPRELCRAFRLAQELAELRQGSSLRDARGHPVATQQAPCLTECRCLGDHGQLFVARRREHAGAVGDQRRQLGHGARGERRRQRERMHLASRQPRQQWGSNVFGEFALTLGEQPQHRAAQRCLHCNKVLTSPQQAARPADLAIPWLSRVRGRFDEARGGAHDGDERRVVGHAKQWQLMTLARIDQRGGNAIPLHSDGDPERGDARVFEPVHIGVGLVVFK